MELVIVQWGSISYSVRQPIQIQSSRLHVYLILILASRKIIKTKVSAVNAFLDGLASIAIFLFVLLLALKEHALLRTNATAKRVGLALFAVSVYARAACMEFALHLKYVNVTMDMKGLIAIPLLVILLVSMEHHMSQINAHVKKGGQVSYAMCLIVLKVVATDTALTLKSANAIPAIIALIMLIVSATC